MSRSISSCLNCVVLSSFSHDGFCSWPCFKTKQEFLKLGNSLFLGKNVTEREKTLSCKILKPKIPTGVRDRLKWTRSEVVENALVTRGKEKFKCRKAFEVGLIDTGGIFERGGLFSLAKTMFAIKN